MPENQFVFTDCSDNFGSAVLIPRVVWLLLIPTTAARWISPHKFQEPC